jgi:hypothetical protein
VMLRWTIGDDALVQAELSMESSYGAMDEEDEAGQGVSAAPPPIYTIIVRPRDLREVFFERWQQRQASRAPHSSSSSERRLIVWADPVLFLACLIAPTRPAAAPSIPTKPEREVLLVVHRKGGEGRAVSPGPRAMGVPALLRDECHQRPVNKHPDDDDQHLPLESMSSGGAAGPGILHMSPPRVSSSARKRARDDDGRTVTAAAEVARRIPAILLPMSPPPAAHHHRPSTPLPRRRHKDIAAADILHHRAAAGIGGGARSVVVQAVPASSSAPSMATAVLSLLADADGRLPKRSLPPARKRPRSDHVDGGIDLLQQQQQQQAPPPPKRRTTTTPRE